LDLKRKRQKLITTEGARLLWEMRPTGCGSCMRYDRTSWF